MRTWHTFIRPLNARYVERFSLRKFALFSLGFKLFVLQGRHSFFKVTMTSETGLDDVYRQPYGVRTINVTDTQILINNKPFYCHGAAKHEDSDVRPFHSD